MFWSRSERRDVYHHYPDLDEVKVEIKKLHDLIVPKLEILMSKLTELQAALDELAAKVTEANAEIEAQLAVLATPGTSDADMDVAIGRVREVVSTVQSGVDRLKSDNPPA